MDASLARTSEALRVAVGEFVRAARRHETLSASVVGALGHLDRHGPATIAQLASAVQVRHQSMAKLVEQLATSGTVEIAPHPSDRRSVHVAITEAGRDLLGAERLRRSAWIAEAMATQLTPEEQSHLAHTAELLRRLAEHPSR